MGSITLGLATPTEAAGVGVIATILMKIGQVTPPLGLNLSVLVSITKNTVSTG
jgi:TRAP-type C4-dicarboxylate transport system permease large subunit